MADKMLRDKLGRFVKGTPQHEDSYRFPKGIYQGYGFKEGQIAWAKGRKFTEEHCKNIGIVRKGKHASPKTEFKKGQHSSKETEYKKGDLILRETIKARRKNQIFPIKDTSIEIKIQSFLSQLHIEYYTHKYISEISHSYQCDILIPSTRTIIETDGCYWHGCPICNKKLNDWQIKTVELDNLRNKELTENGYKIIRLREHDIKQMQLENFKEILQ